MATATGIKPTGMVAITALVDVTMTDTVFSPLVLVTYARDCANVALVAMPRITNTQIVARTKRLKY
jgi:hypothetical protein